MSSLSLLFIFIAYGSGTETVREISESSLRRQRLLLFLWSILSCFCSLLSKSIVSRAKAEMVCFWVLLLFRLCSSIYTEEIGTCCRGFGFIQGLYYDSFDSSSNPSSRTYIFCSLEREVPRIRLSFNDYCTCFVNSVYGSLDSSCSPSLDDEKKSFSTFRS